MLSWRKTETDVIITRIYRNYNYVIPRMLWQRGAQYLRIYGVSDLFRWTKEELPKEKDLSSEGQR